MSIKINETWSIERHTHGGFNLIETHDKGINKKTGKPTVSTRSHYYPKLIMCADKMIECGFDNDAEDLQEIVDYMLLAGGIVANKLKEVIK